VVNRLRSTLTIVVLIAIWVLTACSPAQQPAAGPTESPHGEEMPRLEAVTLGTGEKLRVVATTSIVGDVVSRIGRDDIQLTVLIPPGSDPHTFQPTPKDASAVAAAHVVIVNGAGMEAGWVENLLRNAGGTRPLIPASAGIVLRQGEHHNEDEHGDKDPHVWFDVQNVMAWVRNIEQALGALDPANADKYHKNAGQYLAELQELDGWIVAQVKQVPPERRKLVTSHEAFGYFCDRYGFQQIGTIFPLTTDSQPSAKDLAELQNAIKAEGIPAIFTETTVNPELAERLAGDSGVKVVKLYTGSLSEAGGEADSYSKLMRFDTEAIVKALQ
jgi:manganese/iron transport system substrate-binding protein